MLAMIESLLRQAPKSSIFIVESDNRFSPSDLPDAARWRTREYPPAVVSMLELAE
jgi:hypothetical protein